LKRSIQWGAKRFSPLITSLSFYSGKFDNGGRFDLRLPYAEQGYVDEESDVMGKLASFFGGGKKKEPAPEPVKEEPPKKKGGWPW